MTVTAQQSTVSFAPQAAKIGVDGTFTIGDYTWYRHKAAQVQMGAVDQTQVFPMEVGGAIVPTGAFKTGYFYAGQFTIIPRLEDTFGWLLYGAMGNVSSITDQPVAGMTRHIFRHNPTNAFQLPWMAFRTEIPGEQVADAFGEVGFDCKISGMRIQVPQANKMTAQIGLTGRDFLMEQAPSWTYGNTYEDSVSTPDAGRGQMLIGGVQYPILGAQITLTNGMTTPQQEMVVGDFRPDDFASLSRPITIQWAYKYQNPDLYQRLMTGSTTGTEWDPNPDIISTSGSTYALDMYLQSPGYATGTTPYGFRIRAHRIVNQLQGPPQLAGGQMIVQNFMTTILEPEAGYDYVEVHLENAVAGYTWPT